MLKKLMTDMKANNEAVLVIGAHPDDPELQAGGTSVLFARCGNSVQFISVTNGDAGHHRLSGEELAERRKAEAAMSSRVAGIGYVVMDNRDGELEPTVDNRKDLIRRIREFRPDIIITHRPYDYHPDHRYTSILVQDAVFFASIPNICPDVPPLKRKPVLLYSGDSFFKPLPFHADFAVGIDQAIGAKLDMMHCHESQFYEFLPLSLGVPEKVPEGGAERRAWLESQWAGEWRADPWRELLARFYGEHGKSFRYAEAFELSEYGHIPADPREIFPFLPERTPHSKE
ncbi:MAG: PIG-L family deacetylase [Syntrophales bacterium]|nr:PIG-L family deacetylase [Syntrophales bacterium]